MYNQINPWTYVSSYMIMGMEKYRGTSDATLFPGSWVHTPKIVLIEIMTPNRRKTQITRGNPTQTAENEVEWSKVKGWLHRHW